MTPDLISPQEIAAGDLDGDGDEDLVCTSYSFVLVGENKGDGNFVYTELYANSSEAVSASIVDIDNDGALDILVNNNKEFDYRIFIFKNIGDLDFQLYFGTTEVFPIGNFVVADVNSDGLNEIVYTANERLQFVTNNVLPGFGINFSWSYVIDAVPNIAKICILDLNLDGSKEIVVAYGNRVAMYEISGLSFGPEIVIDSSLSAGVDGIQCIDFNGDGLDDLVTAHGSPSEFSYYENMGSAFASRSSLGVTAYDVQDFKVEDLNGNGLPDLFFSTASRELIWMENDWPTISSPLLIDELPAVALNIVAIDVDRDGDKDIAGSLFSDRSAVWFENVSCAAPKNNDAIILGPEKVGFQWNKVQNATGYHMKGRKIGAGTFSATTTDTSKLVISPILSAGSTFRWKVRAECPMRITPFSNLDFFTMPLLRTSTSLVKFYPNPVPADGNAAFAIDKVLAGDYHLEVYDLGGKLLTSKQMTFTDGANNIGLSLEGFAAGEYFYVLLAETNSFFESGSFIVTPKQ